MAEEEISAQAEETETIDTITIDELDPNEQIQNTDIIMTRDEQGRDRKATMQQVKDFSYPPDASATQAGLINTEDQSFTGKKTFENGIEVGNITKNGNAILTQPETEQLIQVTKSELEEMIAQAVEDATCYKHGDVCRVTSGMICPGYVTSNSTIISFLVPLGKNCRKIQSIPKTAITKLKTIIRASTPDKIGYVGVTAAESTLYTSTDRVSQIDAVATTISDGFNMARFNLKAPDNGKWYCNGDNTGNNYPVVVFLDDFEISF